MILYLFTFFFIFIHKSIDKYLLFDMNFMFTLYRFSVFKIQTIELKAKHFRNYFDPIALYNTTFVIILWLLSRKPQIIILKIINLRATLIFPWFIQFFETYHSNHCSTKGFYDFLFKFTTISFKFHNLSDSSHKIFRNSVIS